MVRGSHLYFSKGTPDPPPPLREKADNVKTDLWALTLAGPTGTSPVLDPVSVLPLNNRLYMSMPFTECHSFHQFCIKILQKHAKNMKKADFDSSLSKQHQTLVKIYIGPMPIFVEKSNYHRPLFIWDVCAWSFIPMA